MDDIMNCFRDHRINIFVVLLAVEKIAQIPYDFGYKCVRYFNKSFFNILTNKRIKILVNIYKNNKRVIEVHLG